MAQLYNGLPCDGPGFDSRWERCRNRATRPSQETVNGVPFLNDLGVDGTLNTIYIYGWLCLTSHRQRGRLETAPPFTVPFPPGIEPRDVA